MFKKEILKLLKEYNIKEDSLEIPPNPEMGDFAFPCFILSKTLKKPPVVIAKELETQLKPNKYIQTIKAEGPYLNFFVNKEILNKIILEQIDDNYGNKPKTNKTTLVEFPSPNTNKPLHLGHLTTWIFTKWLQDFLKHKETQ